MERAAVETVRPFDQCVIAAPSGDWLLIVCGTTRPGNRRARRLAADASRLGIDVVWFDGFDERVGQERVPLDVRDPDAPVQVIVCADAFKRADDRTIRRRVAAVLQHHGLPIPFRRLGAVVSKSAALGRSRRQWRLLRPVIESLAIDSKPIGVVPCDDTGFVVAWNVIRRWPAVRSTTSVEEVRPCVSGS